MGNTYTHISNNCAEHDGAPIGLGVILRGDVEAEVVAGVIAKQGFNIGYNVVVGVKPILPRHLPLETTLIRTLDLP